MLRVDSVEDLLGVCAPFVCPFFLPVVWADSTTIVAVLSHFLYILMHILPLHTRANASLLTSVVGEYACSMRCVRGSAFDRANTPLCYRGTPRYLRADVRRRIVGASVSAADGMRVLTLSVLY